MNTLDWVIKWFSEKAGVEADAVMAERNDNYFEKGWIDSFKFITFIGQIEEHFGIGFSNDEFQDRKFSTIQGLAGIIDGKLKKS